MSSILIIIILLAITIVVMVLTLWRLNTLHKRLSFYNDYVGAVKEEVLAEVVSEQFLQELRNHARLQINQTVAAVNQQFQQETQNSYHAILSSLEESAARILNGELETYRQTVGEARIAATNVAQDTNKLLEEVREDINNQAQAAIREEKRQLLHQLDAKMEDIVNNYLVQALGENVDLGSQKAYIVAQLEAHKEEIKREVNDEF